MIKRLPFLLKILFVEFLFTILLYVSGTNCADPCPMYSFKNPLGIIPTDSQICTLKECLVYQPHSLFYIASYIFVITFVIFIISFIVKKLRNK